MTKRFPQYAAFAGITAGLALGAATASAAELTIYSTTDGDNLKVIAEAVKKAHPDISIDWVRDSTGIMAARVLAEKDNPRADVLFGMAATSMLTFDEMGMFVPYTPKGVERLDKRYLGRQQRAGPLGRHLRLGRRHLLQHHRGREEQSPQADQVGRPDRPGLQGSCRHAESGLLGYRVPGRVQLDPDLGRRPSLGLHGQAAPEHHVLHALRIHTLQAGGVGRDGGRHLLAVPRRQAEVQGCADRHHRAGRGHRLGDAGPWPS